MTRQVPSRRLPFGASVLMALLVAGCGVTSQSSPQPLTSTAAPRVPAPTGPSAHVTQIYLVRGQVLVPTARRIADPVTPQRVLQSLLSGPTAVESSKGMRSALPGTVQLRGLAVRDGTAYVDLSEGLTGIDSAEQVYAIAQLVFTAATWPGVSRLQLMVEGEQVEVPRADGQLTEGAVERSDYASLLTG